MMFSLKKWQAGLLAVLLMGFQLLLAQLFGDWNSWLLAGLGLVLALGTLYLAKMVGLFDSKAKWAWWQHLLFVLGGFLLIRIFNLLGILIMVLQNGGSLIPGNQQAIMDANLPPQMMVTFLLIVAPIVEEVVMRGLIMSGLFQLESLWGLGLSTLIFALIHVPTDMGSWVIYGGMGLVLALVYRISRRLELAIALHLLNNLVATLALLFLVK